jgi:hypothetical protein
MEEDPTTQELRVEQAEREASERRSAGESELEDETEQHERRADKAEYLKRKLEERAQAERRRADE